MDVRKHTGILMNGVVVAVPVLVTLYVVVATVFWLDVLILVSVPAMFDLRIAGVGGAEQIPWYLHGVGLVVVLILLYLVGLLARNWLFRWFFDLAELTVERIPLVKSIYTAVRDMLKLFRTDETKGGGQPVSIALEDGKTTMLGMVMRQDAGALVESDSERVAVYLPMSYQIGGFTVFVPRERVQPLENMTVERLLKVAMTGGAGVEREPGRRPRRKHAARPGDTTTMQHSEEDAPDGAE